MVRGTGGITVVVRVGADCTELSGESSRGSVGDLACVLPRVGGGVGPARPLVEGGALAGGRFLPLGGISMRDGSKAEEGHKSCCNKDVFNIKVAFLTILVLDLGWLKVAKCRFQKFIRQKFFQTISKGHEVRRDEDENFSSAFALRRFDEIEGSGRDVDVESQRPKTMTRNKSISLQHARRVPWTKPGLWCPLGVNFLP